MAQLQFLDSSGLKSVLNKIKDTFVPKSRKIANIDLNNDITAEELGNNLKDYVDGKSAYEVAVDNGFVGSERRWLESLKGERGNSGVYVGAGDMPEDCNVQIDPNGEVFEIDDTLNIESENLIKNKAITAAINDINSKLGNIDTALDSIISLQESYIGGEE